MAKLKKSPNDLSVLFELVLEDLSRTEVQLDLRRSEDRKIIGEALVQRMRDTRGWFVNLGDEQFMKYSDSYVSEWAKPSRKVN